MKTGVTSVLTVSMNFSDGMKIAAAVDMLGDSPTKIWQGTLHMVSLDGGQQFYNLQHFIINNNCIY